MWLHIHHHHHHLHYHHHLLLLHVRLSLFQLRMHQMSFGARIHWGSLKSLSQTPYP